MPDRAPPWQANALWLDATGRLTVAAKAFVDLLYRRTGGLGANIVDVVAGLPTASAALVYTWVSPDGGATWRTPSPQTLPTEFYDSSGAVIATQAIIGTRNDLTGNITLSLGSHTGLPVTVPIPAFNGTTQLIGTVVMVGKVQTSVTFVSSIDTGAVAGGTGGPAK